MKKRSIQFGHPATIELLVSSRGDEMTRDVGNTRTRSGIALMAVCVLVGLVAFFAGARAQGPAATATPAPTATPFPTFAPGRPPRP